MKQNIKLITLAGLLPAFIASVLTVASCAKNEIDAQSPACEAKVSINITSDFNDFSTKEEQTKAFVQNTFVMRWNGGENVYVYGVMDSGTDITCLGSLTATVVSGTDNKVADLGGSIVRPKEGTTLTLVYSPALNSQPDVNSNAVSIDLSSQTGEADDVTFVAYATVTYGGTTNASYRTAFSFATSILRVNVSNISPNLAITSANLGDIETGCRLQFLKNASPLISGCYYGNTRIISRTFTSDNTFSSNDKGNAAFYIAIPNISANAMRKLTITQEGNVKYKFFRFASDSAPCSMVLNSIASFRLPDGALKGEFTVNAEGKKIRFSKGNLVATIDANGSPTAWKFATNQYDCIGVNVANTSIGSAAGDVDLFGWSTEKTTYGINTSTLSSDYSGDFKDWGTAIDGNGTWRTLSIAEWQDLFFGSYTSEIRKDKYKYGVTVCGKINCVVLLPDNWKWEGIVGTNWQTNENDVIEYSEETSIKWSTMQEAGAVCLPAAGYRGGSGVYSVGGDGYYWSSAASDGDRAYSVSFNSFDVFPGSTGYRGLGVSVRLITESN